jgi:hypothetical protein
MRDFWIKKKTNLQLDSLSSLLIIFRKLKIKRIILDHLKKLLKINKYKLRIMTKVKKFEKVKEDKEKLAQWI